MPGIVRTSHRVGIVYEDEEEHTSYCPNCQTVGVSNKLKNRILNKGEVKPPDYDEWKQCHECGTLVPSHELKNEWQLSGIVELTDNPFDRGEVIMGLDKRKKGKTKKRKKQVDDEEVQKQLDKGVELVSYSVSPS